MNAGIAGLSLTYAITVIVFKIFRFSRFDFRIKFFFEMIKITPILIWMVKAFSEFESSLTAVERIKEYCDLDHEVEQRF